ncbi:MAG: M48 family metallopeptidase [Selenomonadales bacterium]|nr:M48 family metallopeptidase [Selenomonadales bacterium]
MDSIILNGHHFSVSIIRTSRKTTRMNLTTATHIEIRAPFSKTDDDIRSLLYKQRDWIATWLPKLKLPISDILPETLFLRGKKLPLLHNIVPGSKITATHNEDAFILTYPPDSPAIDLRYAIVKHYRQTAKTILTEKTHVWAEKIGVTVNRITIKEQRSLWGSCSTKHNLNYNWRVIEAADEVIDYLVIHELCHLRHMNHSHAFWKTVSTFDPNYDEHRRRLYSLPTNLPPMPYIPPTQT